MSSRTFTTAERSNAEIANVCGGLLGRCMQIGVSISWPDAWATATALWLDVPLVAHDRDLERIPGLRVPTVQTDWEIRERDLTTSHPAALWVGERCAGARYDALSSFA